MFCVLCVCSAACHLTYGTQHPLQSVFCEEGLELHDLRSSAKWVEPWKRIGAEHKLMPINIAEVAATFPFDLTMAAVRHDGWDKAFVHPYKGDADTNAKKRALPRAHSTIPPLPSLPHAFRAGCDSFRRSVPGVDVRRWWRSLEQVG